MGEDFEACSFSGTGPLRFGFMDGAMDEVRVYDRAITGSEVALIYSSENVNSVGDEFSTILLLMPLGALIVGMSLKRRTTASQ